MVAEHNEYVYKEFSGSEPLKASIWYNRDPSDVAKPIAIYFHGGNFVLGNKDVLSPAYVEKLLELGFGAVVSPNYRLCPTVSLSEGPVQDAKDSYIWSRIDLPQRLAEDASVKLIGERIVTFGHSAGATLALLTASLPQKPLAILDIFGLKYFEDEFYHNPNLALVQMLPEFDAAVLDKIHNDFLAPSAAPPPDAPGGPDFGNHRVTIRSSFPPTYFIHGSKDVIVDVKFSRRAHIALEAQEVDTELVMEEANHGFDAGAKPGDKYFELVAEGFEFLARHALPS
ncbi:Alpha/Beta hydrolase protein [Aspergillus heterothallicus]